MSSHRELTLQRENLRLTELVAKLERDLAARDLTIAKLHVGWQARKAIDDPIWEKHDGAG